MGDLLHQIGHRLHGAHEVARRHIAHVTGGHAERRLERGPPGPRDHGGGQARGGLPRPRHQVDLLGRPDALGHQSQRIAAPPQIGQPFLAQPVGHRPSTAITPDRWSPAPVPGQAPGAPRFEHHGGDDAGQDGGLGPVEELVGQRLGHQQIGLVVDAGQSVATGRERPVLDVVQLLEHGHPVAQLEREEVGPLRLPLGEGAVEDLVGGVLIEAGDQVDGQVVGGAEGRAQIGRRGDGHAGRLAEGGLGGPDHDGMALLVEAPPAGPSGQLQVLARREAGPSGPAVLGEALDHHRAGRHVDAQRQRLGGEDHPEQSGGEALLDRLAEDRHQAGVVGRDPGLQPLQPVVVAQHAEVVVAQRFDARLGDLADGGPFVPVGQAHAVADALADGVVAGGPAEDEDDGREQLLVVERGRPARSAGASDTAAAGPCPGAATAAAGPARPGAPPGRSAGLPRRPAVGEERQQQRVVVLAPVEPRSGGAG